MKNQQPSQKRLLALMLASSLLPATISSVWATTDAAMTTSAPSLVEADKNKLTKLTLLQTGDIHGHMIPRPCLRCDDTPMLGGLAYMYTKIQQVRAANANTLLFNTGDTIQGSAEALFTKGQAVVDVLDQFGYDGYAPGNWDYVYGIDRFLELFGNNRWNGVAANVYYDEIVYPEKAGQTLLPPYRILTVDGVKIGLLGLSSERAINALGPWVTKGIKFTADGAELPGYIDTLRNTEKVDLIVLVSEFGLAKNVYFGENYAGIDVILEIDWQGARQVRSLFPAAISIFVLPPSRALLEQRLRSRNTDSDAVINRRLRDAVSDMSHYDEFEFIVVNDDFERALLELHAIVTAQRLRLSASRRRLAPLLANLLAES